MDIYIQHIIGLLMYISYTLLHANSSLPVLSIGVRGVTYIILRNDNTIEVRLKFLKNRENADF